MSHSERWRSLSTRICTGERRVPSLYPCWPEWKRDVEKMGGEPGKNNLEAFVGFLQLNVNVQTVMSMNHVTVPREDSSLEALASGGDDRVWRWKGLPS